MRANPGSIMPRFLVLDEEGRELGLADMPGRRLFAGEQPGALVVRNIVRASGEERWLVVRSSPVIDEGTKRIIYVVNIFENITEVKRAELAETFMAEASRVLVSSTDPRATLQRVARLAVPQIADWCAVHLIDEHDELERVALHHSDPATVARSEELERQSPPALDDEGGIGEVIRTGRARIFTDVQAPAPGTTKPPSGFDGLRELGARSVIVVPLLGAMKTAVGTITLASLESVRRLTPADLGLAVRLGRRSGTAVERARIYTERARIAHILQRALLPESLPRVPGAEVQALYSAAGELNEVGGDFYDVFHYDPDCWMLVVGDVCGKGPRAAGVTALARHTLRAAALSGQSPTEMLETLHRALNRQPPGADLCTACLVTLGPDEGSARLTVALAGHQPALLIDRDGVTTPLGTPGTLLGVVDPVEITETRYEMEVGQTVLLYTDGVIEAGRPDNQLGEAGLRAICARAPELDLIGLLEAIEREALEHASGALHDDIALLALRLLPAP
jgi:PAS domain-containing protein